MPYATPSIIAYLVPGSGGLLAGLVGFQDLAGFENRPLATLTPRLSNGHTISNSQIAESLWEINT
jgi:hypothetical protein